MESKQSLDQIHMALRQIRAYKQETCYIDCDTDCGHFIVHSQMAAEHLAKTLMTRRKVPSLKSHDVGSLAEHMRNHPLADVPDSDWQALTARVLSLNGATHMDHQAGYGTFIITPDALSHATNRLVNTIPFLVDEIGSVLKPSRYGASMGLSQVCLGMPDHEAGMKTHAHDLLSQCARMIETATAVFDTTNTSKTDVSWSSPPVVSFLSHLPPLEQLCRVELPQMLRQIRKEDDGPSSNPFEMDTSQLPSPFDS